MITSTQIDKSIDIWKELIRTLYSVVSELNKIDPDKYHNLKGELWFAARPNDGEIKIVSFDTLYLDSNTTNINPKVMGIPIKFLMMPINKVNEIAKNNRLNFIKNYVLNNSKDIDPEFNDIVNDNFYDLI